MVNTQTIQFPADTLELVHKIIKRYPEGKQKSALLPILHLAAEGINGTEDGKKYAILGALRLYLDFINLFLYMLRLLGNRR